MYLPKSLFLVRLTVSIKFLTYYDDLRKNIYLFGKSLFFLFFKLQRISIRFLAFMIDCIATLYKKYPATNFFELFAS